VNDSSLGGGVRKETGGKKHKLKKAVKSSHKKRKSGVPISEMAEHGFEISSTGEVHTGNQMAPVIREKFFFADEDLLQMLHLQATYIEESLVCRNDEGL